MCDEAIAHHHKLWAKRLGFITIKLYKFKFYHLSTCARRPARLSPLAHCTRSPRARGTCLAQSQVK